METNAEQSVYWKGALKSALKGIPQGLLLGALGFALLVGGIYALGALAPVFTTTWLAGPFGSFLFTKAATDFMVANTALPAIGSLLSMLNPLPVIALNSVLTAVGNFITGGDLAVAQYRQEVDHRRNEGRIATLESREQAVEYAITQQSQALQSILAQGPRTGTGFTHAEQARVDQKTPNAALSK